MATRRCEEWVKRITICELPATSPAATSRTAYARRGREGLRCRPIHQHEILRVKVFVSANLRPTLYCLVDTLPDAPTYPAADAIKRRSGRRICPDLPPPG
ncbi:hypothetical protein MAPG_07247 [Magnaporthiopsis poae ATCC 64411]|uniref:Uncharacterized protein n=1 Tax=Magnaporthiopsis poae (strain ATCC 64411 / 73-15) TaxID=644358 RepID=A0A0C4E458_MAGP6|nr:hypothetical protein MAPG_07247 [Magnaporthiopsis poae ATCC 64411]